MSENPFIDILQAFRDLEAEVSLHCLQVELFAYTQKDVDAVPDADQKKYEKLFPDVKSRETGWRNIGRVSVDGELYYLCEWINTPRRSKWLLSFRAACAKAGAALPKATREALSVPTRDAVDYWLTFMWRTIRPALKVRKTRTVTWSDGSEFRFLLAWDHSARVACDAIEKSGLVDKERKPDDTRAGEYMPADWIEYKHGIRRSRLSEGKKAGGIRSMPAPAGTVDRENRPVRILYHVEDAVKHCEPKRVKKNPFAAFKKPP